MANVVANVVANYGQCCCLCWGQYYGPYNQYHGPMLWPMLWQCCVEANVVAMLWQYCGLFSRQPAFLRLRSPDLWPGLFTASPYLHSFQYHSISFMPPWYFIADFQRIVFIMKDIPKCLCWKKKSFDPVSFKSRSADMFFQHCVEQTIDIFWGQKKVKHSNKIGLHLK